MAAKRTRPRSNRKKTPASQAVDIPGIVYSEDAIGIAIESVPRLDNFFYSNAYQIRLTGDELHFIFGQFSSFSNESSCLDALEIVMPLDSVLDHFIQSIYKTSEESGKKTPFINTLEKTVDQINSKYLEGNSEQPTYEFQFNPSMENWRQYCSNFSYISLSRGQAMIEFLRPVQTF